MQRVRTVENEEWLRRMADVRSGLSEMLYAMYSSLTGGITTDPALMMIPADDHLAHRGDGVFESLKCIGGSLYNLNAHLDRLKRSCEGVGMALPCARNELERAVLETIRVGGKRDCLVRVLVSRGTGNMGIDPAQCKGPELYVIAYRYTARIQDGKLRPARAAISSVPIKPPQLATIKTCNYLPNALMKLEANRRHLDFVISLDQNGNLAEGATENIGLLTQDRELLMPPPKYILTGTTARRALDLAQQLVVDGTLQCAEYRDLPPSLTARAREMFVFGTTTDVTSLIEWEGTPVGDGTPGPIAARLLDLLQNDMTPRSDTLTEIFT